MLKDTFGQEIKEGVVICYPASREAPPSVAIVQEVETRTEERWGSTVTYQKLRVLSAGNGKYGYRPEKLRKTYVTEVERVLVLPHVTPEMVRALTKEGR